MLSIKVNIADRVYPLTVGENEEAEVRTAAQNISDKVKEYESNYAVKDKQDLLAMTALNFATSALKNTSESENIGNELKNKLSDLSGLIADQINT